VRTDFSTFGELIDRFVEDRGRTADGRAADRVRTPFPGARPVPTVGRQAGVAARDLRSTLEGRHSTLHYGLDPVRTSDVLATVTDALRRDGLDWHDGAGPLEAFVFAMRSDDLDPGVYRVTPVAAERVIDLPGPDHLVDLGVQREFATAAGIVSVAADLDHADTWAGAHGYRVAMLRASAAVYDVNLRLQATGLVGTVYAGFIPGAVRRMLRTDGASRQQMFATTYACPPTPPVGAEGP